MKPSKSAAECGRSGPDDLPIRLPASLSLDLDNKWSYLKSHGDPNWKSLPSYLNRVVPGILDVLDDLGIRITFFVVGQDAAMQQHHDVLRRIEAAGHEIANHSFHHETCLHRYTPEELDREIGLAENALQQIAGRKPIGFRGPGFSLSDQTLTTLIRRGYRYDGSTFPTWLAPLMRARYFMTGSFNRRQRKEREALFGKLSDGLLPNRAFYWKADSGRILEIPVSTFPGCRIPIHATYLQYLASYSGKAAASYWTIALKAFHATGGSPSFLLHPLDFTGKDDQPDLAFFPGMNLPTRDKIRGTHRFLDMLRNQFELLTMQQFADLQAGRDLPERPIRRVRRGAS